MDVEILSQEPEKSNLSDIKAKAESEENQNHAFMQPGEKKKGKRGRPRLTDEEKRQRREQKAQSGPSDAGEGPQIASSDICKPVVSFLSQAGARVVDDPRGQMTPDEMEGIAGAMGMVLDKYAPMAFSKYGPEAILVLSLGQYGLRLAAIRKYKALQKKESEKKPVDENIETTAGPRIMKTEEQNQFSADTAKKSEQNPADIGEGFKMKPNSWVPRSEQ